MSAKRTDMHRLQELVRLHRKGVGCRETARLLGLGPNIERRYRRALSAGGLLLGPSDELPPLETLRAAVEAKLPTKAAPHEASSVEAYAEFIEAKWRAGGFVRRKRNVLLIGPSGVGKSHIAQSIGHRACRMGYRVLFTGAHQMLGELRADRADHSYGRKMSRFTGPDLLIVDDVGLRPLKGDVPEDLYEVIRRRYERGSIIVTSNRAVEEWYALRTVRRRPARQRGHGSPAARRRDRGDSRRQLPQPAQVPARTVSGSDWPPRTGPSSSARWIPAISTAMDGYDAFMRVNCVRSAWPHQQRSEGAPLDTVARRQTTRWLGGG